jgi:hypothetical protein
VACTVGDEMLTVTPGRLDPACVTVPVKAPVVPCANAPAATRSSRKKQIVNRCTFIVPPRFSSINFYQWTERFTARAEPIYANRPLDFKPLQMSDLDLIPSIFGKPWNSTV